MDVRLLRGKVAIVTDASTDHGIAICKKLVEYGIIVIGFAANTEQLFQIEHEIAASGMSDEDIFPMLLNMWQNEDEIMAMFSAIESQYGGLDILVNNSWTSKHTALEVFERFRQMQRSRSELLRVRQSEISAARIDGTYSFKELDADGIALAICNIMTLPFNGVAIRPTATLPKHEKIMHNRVHITFKYSIKQYEVV